MTDNCGVYEIVNVVNGKRYIGSSIDLLRRHCRHFYELGKNQHKNAHLQSSFNKYGATTFLFRVLLYCDLENVLLYEQMCIDGLKPEYNLAKDAKASMQGRHHTEESNRKNSLAHLGRIVSEETCKKLSLSHLGKALSEEARKNMSLAGMGHAVSEETREKISLTSTGHDVSDETRRKIGLAYSGLPPSFLGHHHTEESKRKISEAMMGERNAFFGKSHADETKRNMSEAQHRRQAREHGLLVEAI